MIRDPLPGDMPAEEFRRAGHEVIDWIADYLRDPRRFPVQSATRPGELTGLLPVSAPEQGEPMERILEDFRELILPRSTLWNHPLFFSYFSVSSSGPGILAEALAAALNMNGMVWRSSPAVTELEQVTLGWLRQWLRLPDSFFGIIHDTASLSTFHAILAARMFADPDIRERGSSPGFVLYASEHAHSSVEKGAMALGIGRRHVRKIASDEAFRMRPDALRDAIRADRQEGLRPFCAVATVGTTSTTSVDPVPAIADICEAENLWLHVDAAYGGHAAILPEYAHYLEGAARAHSLVINPHKWLFTPIDLSAFYTRYPRVLEEALSLVPEYLRTPDDPAMLNYMDYGVALGRRFRALKLWFVMRYFGRERIAALIRNHIRMAQDLALLIEADARFELCAPAPMSLVCFRLRGPDEATRALLEKLNETHGVFFSHTVLHGRFVMRWSIGNIHTTWEDIVKTWDMARALAQ